ncbi:MAG: lytic polysaccharide monooxygenase [Halobacteriovoraceae bacterium]|nr:lytic polysaccharide monooxygenase [Halobacteriovoraceae bacterium]
MRKLSWLLLSVFLVPLSHAHFRMKDNSVVVPRSNDDGLKTPPCGGIVKTTTPMIVKAGSQITINWEETINHPGKFQVFFSHDGDQTFEKIFETVDQQDTDVDRADPNTYHQYSTTIPLPEYNCENCTIQMIQVMEENPANPSFYYSCADVTLIEGNGPPPRPPVEYPNDPVDCTEK